MKVVFRTDANLEIGLGHLMRCLALAQSFERHHVETEFWVKDSTVRHCRERHDLVSKIKVIPSFSCDKEETKWVRAELTGDPAVGCLVIDGYQFSSFYRANLSALQIPLVLFDDNNSSGDLHADIVINSAQDTSKLGYDLENKNVKHLLGADFRVLREEFNFRPDVPWHMRHGLTISLGGADVNNYSLMMLRAISKLDSAIPIRLVTGGAYAHVEQLQQYLLKIANPVQHIHNCQDIADVFSHSKLVIAAAGSTQYELLACATPAILLCVADNQKFTAELAKQQGWCEVYNADETAIDIVAQKARQMLSEDDKLLEKHRVAEQLGNVNGAANAVSEILDYVEEKSPSC